jgi:hypothetical protein
MNNVVVARLADEEATAKRGMSVAEFALPIEKSAHGVEVPMPTLPVPELLLLKILVPSPESVQ